MMDMCVIKGSVTGTDGISDKGAANFRFFRDLRITFFFLERCGIRVELSSTLEQLRPFDYHHLMAEICCIPTSLCLYK
jgi:hypothetical protein